MKKTNEWRGNKEKPVEDLRTLNENYEKPRKATDKKNIPIKFERYQHVKPEQCLAFRFVDHSTDDDTFAVKLQNFSNRIFLAEYAVGIMTGDDSVIGSIETGCSGQQGVAEKVEKGGVYGQYVHGVTAVSVYHIVLLLYYHAALFHHVVFGDIDRICSNTVLLQISRKNVSLYIP